LAESFGLGLNAQNQQYNIGSGLLQLDPQLRGLFANLGTSNLTDALNIQNAATNLFSSTAGATSGGGGGGAPSYSPTQAIGAGLLNSGIRSLNKGIGGLFQAPTAYQSQDNTNYYTG
jgi:hypothetical protein